jgi:hypothetical protein
VQSIAKNSSGDFFGRDSCQDRSALQEQRYPVALTSSSCNKTHSGELSFRRSSFASHKSTFCVNSTFCWFVVLESGHQLSADPATKSDLTGFIIPIRDVRASAGAGFIHPLVPNFTKHCF